MNNPQTQAFDNAGLNQPSATNRLLQQLIDINQLLLREMRLLNMQMRELTNGLPVSDDLEALRQDPYFNDFTQMEN